MLQPGEMVTRLQVLDVYFGPTESKTVSARPFHSISFRYGGRISLTVGEETVLSDAGCVTYVPAGLTYQTEIIDGGYMVAVHIYTTGGQTGGKPQVFRPEHETMMREQFSALLERFRVGREQDYKCLSMLYEILAEIEHETTRDARTAIPRRMREAREHIDRGYGSHFLSVASLSEEAGVSEVYFRREFKRCFGMTPTAYIKKVRMDNAKALLRTGYYPVSEVAERCGFETVSYFSSEFHRLTGMTPTEYVKAQET